MTIGDIVVLGPEEDDKNLIKHGPQEVGPQLGAWYYLKVKMRDKGDEPGAVEDVLVCCMFIGSNYCKVQTPPLDGSSREWRIHFDNFTESMRPAYDADAYIRSQIETKQQKSEQLLAKVQELTQRLGMSQQQKLPGASHTAQSNALVALSGAPDVNGYKNALTVAKEKQLPELFKEIETTHKELASWMKAPSMAMMAQVGDLKEYIEEIDGRIFSVSLYAGLTENADKVADGAPAKIDAPLHVMQRMLFMDEESLLGYKHGGMDFNSIRDFDTFIAEPENRNRILPFPRTLVAFRVRRYKKERAWDGSLSNAYFNMQMEGADKSTFFYIRNGEQIWRISCDLDFPELIFPKRGELNLLEPKMFKIDWKEVHWMSIDAYEASVAAVKKRTAEIKAAHKKWKEENPKATWIDEPYEFRHGTYDEERRLEGWELFSPDSVYYDDALKKLEEKTKEYNRISLIIQGLFDRSMVLHPHLPVKTWTPEGFDRAIKLITDGDMNLYYKDAPNFENFRAACNQAAKAGAIFVGQQDYWQKKEAEQENERRENNTRYEHRYNLERFTPRGDPGPTDPGPASAVSNRGNATFTWTKERRGSDSWDREARWNAERKGPVTRTLSIPVSELLCVDGYKLGDFKQFFQDPRTRSEYMAWAPLLLAAEEYQAQAAGLPSGLGRKNRS